jgi:FKBP-type peptidyl-prolyl cis-trans isomerase SlyD
MKVEQGKLVTIEYELTIDDGELIIESSKKTGPLEYEHGVGKMLPGLESRIEGCVKGDERDGVIPAKEAYGNEEDLPTKVIPRSDFPSDETIEKGRSFEASDADGNPVEFVVTDVSDDEVTVRFQHPLAGKDIRFKVKILAIREPGAPPPPPAAAAAAESESDGDAKSEGSKEDDGKTDDGKTDVSEKSQ